MRNRKYSELTLVMLLLKWLCEEKVLLYEVILECWRFFLVSPFLIGARNSVRLEKFLFFNIQSQVLLYENPKQNNRVAMK